jgi:hypothetical protein
VFCVIRGCILVVSNHPRRRKTGKAHEQLHLIVVDGVTSGDSLVFEAVPFFIVHGFDFKDLWAFLCPGIHNAVSVAPDMSPKRGVGPLFAGPWIYFRNSHPGCF